MAWSIFRILASALVVAIPAEALACSVCFTARAASLRAYYGTTALMLSLPLLMIGGCAYWVYRRSRHPPRQ